MKRPPLCPWRLLLHVPACCGLAVLAGCAGAPMNLALPPWPEGLTADISQTRQQRAARAVEAFERQRAYAEYQVARDALERGDLRACEETLRQLLSRGGNHPEARDLLAEVLRRTGREVEAVGQIEPAAGQKSDETTVRQISETTPVRPNNPQIPLDRAVRALKNGDPASACRVLEAAMGDFPQQAALHRCLGIARYRLGDYRAAELALRQALSLDKSDALSYFLMGCTLAKLGHTEAAGQHLARAGRLDAHFQSARR